MVWNPNLPGSTSQADNQFPTTPNTVVPSSARTTTGQSGAANSGGQIVSLLVDVTVVSGTTPTLVVSVQWSNDGATWVDADPADAFTSVNATGRKVKTFDRKATQYRVVWTIAGTTPSFTFSVTEMDI